MKWNTLNKDKSIKAVLERISSNIGEENLCLVDHWDADLCAIGIAKKDDNAQLVYISTYNKPYREFYYELEFSSKIKADTSNLQLEGDVKYNELIKIIKSHLSVD